jgi:hypothetical protein
MATYEKKYVLEHGSAEAFARKYDIWKLYESDHNFHGISSPAEDVALSTSPYIKNPRVVWQRGDEKRLLNQAASKNLLRACWRGDAVAAEEAIAAGANVDYVDDTDTRMTVLHEAAFEGKFAVVKLLLEGGANPNPHNAGGNTPLMLAARRGHLEVVKALVAGGAKVGADDGEGGTAFSNANEHPEVQSFLRERMTQQPTRQTHSAHPNPSKPWWKFW